MGKLYIRLLGVMALFTVITVTMQELVIERITEIAVRDAAAEWDRVKARERLRPIFRFTEAALREVPQAEWPARFKDLLGYFVFPAEVVSLEAAAGESQDGRERLAKGDIWMAEREPGGWIAAARLAQSPMALVLTLPEPKSRRDYWRRVANSINAGIELVTLGLLALVLLRPFWRDLARLDRAAAEIGEGRFEVQTRVPPSSPLRRLAASFDVMKEKAAAMIRSQREMTYAVSHELRNPLMRLRFRYQLARDEADVASMQRHLALMQRDIDELDRLSDEVLTYAKLNAEGRAQQLEHVDVAALAAQAADAAREEVELSGAALRVSLEGGAPAAAAGDPEYILRAVKNLALNAVKFANSAVRLRVESDASSVRLSVEDDGPGVPPEERARIFQPFARLDRSRDRKTGGYGMGLAIVQRIAAFHGGEVDVGTSDLGGARFTLVLPRHANLGEAS